MKQTVVITGELPAIAAEILSQQFDLVSHPTEVGRTEDEMITIASEADGLITLLGDPVTRRVLCSNPNLRVVGNYAVGVDNIDLRAAAEMGIAVTHTPHVLTEATADLTMALLLAVARRIVEGDRMIRSGEFSGWDPLMLLGTSLQQKRLGIIGMGRIGAAVARRALGFGLEVIYHSRTAHTEVERELGICRVPLEELLETSDFVSVHAPLTADTKHLIDADALERMKSTAHLVNTSRGPLIDESALAEALLAGRIAGAALDVYEREPEVDPRLLHLNNVVLLPHLGSATLEARSAMARIVASDVAAVLNERPPKYPVTGRVDSDEE